MTYPALQMLRIGQNKNGRAGSVMADEKEGGKARLEHFVEQSFEM
jgi:hypothetical protein